MDLEALKSKLISAARLEEPSERVPYAFEKRVMARLAAPPRNELWTFWNHYLWRAAAICLAVALCSGLWTAASSHFEAPGDFSHEFETAVFVMAEPVDDAW